jgi:hypothetical protein
MAPPWEDTWITDHTIHVRLAAMAASHLIENKSAVGATPQGCRQAVGMVLVEIEPLGLLAARVVLYM